MMQQSGRMALAPAQATNIVISALVFGVLIPTLIHWTIGSKSRPATATVTAVLLIGAFATTLTLAQPASAQSCSLVVNGQSISSGSTVVVEEQSDLTVGFTGTEVTGGQASVKFGPLNVYSDSFTLTEAKTGSEERTFDRSKIADKGVGLYAIDAVVNTNGADCAFDFLIDVQGDPLSAPAGKGAAAALGLGALGSVAAIGKEIASALAQVKSALG